MFARVVINIEAPLAHSFHYFVPGDLRSSLAVGHLVEVEFGRRLAQAIVIALEDQAPVEETKPIIGIIDDVPVVKWWQIDLAIWLSEHYLAPLNSCLRLMLYRLDLHVGLILFMMLIPTGLGKVGLQNFRRPYWRSCACGDLCEREGFPGHWVRSRIGNRRPTNWCVKVCGVLLSLDTASD